MKMKLSCVALLLLALAGGLHAADTTITIPEMECKGCARQVATALRPLNGVAEVRTDVQTRKAIVKPKANMVLSPKAMWEALEKIGKPATKLEGPSGTFTARPQN